MVTEDPGLLYIPPNGRWIGCRLHIIGIRVWRDSCQLAAKSGSEWITLSSQRDLPVQVSRNAEELKAAASDPLGLTVYQVHD